MTDEENEPMDALDRLIADAARDYHTPPARVPRDEMWTAIVAARAERAPAPAPTVVSLADRRADRAARTRALWAVAAAAAVFLATGVGVGRWWGHREATANGPVAAPASQVAATAPTPAPAAPAADSAIARSDVGSDVAPDLASAAPDVRRAETVASAPRSAARPEAARSAGPDAYDLVVLRHFAQAEALLVSYRADTVDAAMDGRLAAWARPLLADTRLLLDSPAATDPRRRRLLEDLELVLAQFARLAPSSARDSTGRETARDRGERALIDGSLRQQQLLPRLRTLVPAGT